jgi:hypothetical protein
MYYSRMFSNRMRICKYRPKYDIEIYAFGREAYISYSE